MTQAAHRRAEIEQWPRSCETLDTLHFATSHVAPERGDVG